MFQDRRRYSLTLKFGDRIILLLDQSRFRFCMCHFWYSCEYVCSSSLVSLETTFVSPIVHQVTKEPVPIFMLMMINTRMNRGVRMKTFGSRRWRWWTRIFFWVCLAPPSSLEALFDFSLIWVASESKVHCFETRFTALEAEGGELIGSWYVIFT